MKKYIHHFNDTFNMDISKTVFDADSSAWMEGVVSDTRIGEKFIELAGPDSRDTKLQNEYISHVLNELELIEKSRLRYWQGFSKKTDFGL